MYNHQERRRASDGGRATAGERWMCTEQIQQQYGIRVGGRVVGVHKIPCFIHESHHLGWCCFTDVPTKIYWSVLLGTTPKSGAGREIQPQQYGSSSTSREECCRSEFFFFYNRVTPWGGAATNVTTQMYCCCLLLCSTNESGGGRATAGEQESTSK